MNNLQGLTLILLLVMYVVTQSIILSVVTYPTRLFVLMSMAIVISVFIMLINGRRVD